MGPRRKQKSGALHGKQEQMTPNPVIARPLHDNKKWSSRQGGTYLTISICCCCCCFSCCSLSPFIPRRVIGEGPQLRKPCRRTSIRPCLCLAFYPFSFSLEICIWVLIVAVFFFLIIFFFFVFFYCFNVLIYILSFFFFFYVLMVGFFFFLNYFVLFCLFSWLPCSYLPLLFFFFFAGRTLYLPFFTLCASLFLCFFLFIPHRLAGFRALNEVSECSNGVLSFFFL